MGEFDGKCTSLTYPTGKLQKPVGKVGMKFWNKKAMWGVVVMVVKIKTDINEQCIYWTLLGACVWR